MGSSVWGGGSLMRLCLMRLCLLVLKALPELSLCRRVIRVRPHSG